MLPNEINDKSQDNYLPFGNATGSERINTDKDGGRQNNFKRLTSPSSREDKSGIGGKR